MASKDKPRAELRKHAHESGEAQLTERREKRRERKLALRLARRKSKRTSHFHQLSQM